MKDLTTTLFNKVLSYNYNKTDDANKEIKIVKEKLRLYLLNRYNLDEKVLNMKFDIRASDNIKNDFIRQSKINHEIDIIIIELINVVAFLFYNMKFYRDEIPNRKPFFRISTDMNYDELLKFFDDSELVNERKIFINAFYTVKNKIKICDSI